MTTPKPTLDEVYQRWRTAHPTLTDYVSVASPGYRYCKHRGCRVQIEAVRERAYCFGHGGKPNVLPVAGLRNSEWEQHISEVRADRRHGKEEAYRFTPQAIHQEGP